MVKEDEIVRDFVYLVWERVRSMSAQLLQGVPQNASKESGHDLGGKGEIQGSIPALLKGRGEGDYRYFRTQNETRSLHHYVYSLFEGSLQKRGVVMEVDHTFEAWAEDTFHDREQQKPGALHRLLAYAQLDLKQNAVATITHSTPQFCSSLISA